MEFIKKLLVISVFIGPVWLIWYTQEQAIVAPQAIEDGDYCSLEDYRSCDYMKWLAVPHNDLPKVLNKDGSISRGLELETPAASEIFCITGTWTKRNINIAGTLHYMCNFKDPEDIGVADAVAYLELYHKITFNECGYKQYCR